MNAGSIPGGLTGGLLVLAAALLVVAVLLARELLRQRRRFDGEVRELVRAVEDVRGGGDGQVAGTRSALGLAHDALARLAGDLAERRAELERERKRAQSAAAAGAGAAQSAAVVTDADGDVRQVSRAAEALLGRSAAELVGRPLGDLFDAEAFRDFLPRLSRRSLAERGLELRTRLRRGESASFDADVAVRLLADDEGRRRGYRLELVDAGPLVELERRFEEAEARYAGLIGGLSDGVALVRDGTIVEANAALAEMTGTAANGLAGRPLRDLVSTRDVLAVDARLVDLASRLGTRAEWTCRLGDEGPAVRIQGCSIRHGGEPAVLLLVRDETLDRRMEAELRRNEAQLDAVLEASPDGVVVLADRPGGAIVQMTNRAFLDRFGLRARSLLGAPQTRLAEALREHGHGGQAVAALLDGGETDRSTTVSLLGTRPGEIEVRVAPLTDRGDRRLGRIVVVRDLSEQRESERRLQRQADELQLGKVMLEKAYAGLEGEHRELAAQVDRLQRYNQELRTLDDMKSNLLGNVSHELQTPLVAIRGYTEMIVKERLGPITEEQRKGLRLCLKNIDRLIAMIDNLLVFSTTKGEGKPLTLSTFELAPLLDETAQLLDEKLRSREIELTLDVDPELRLHADREQVQQVLINLLSNAIKFNREGGRVRVAAGRGRGGQATLRVEDTGVGIPADQLDRIFDRHYKARTPGAPETSGSGIGLAIVRDVLRLHGCRIHVTSEVGRGTTFEFALPLAGELADEGRDVDEPAAGAHGATGPASERGDGSAAADPAPDAQPPVEQPAAPSDDAPGQSEAPRPRFRIIRPKGNGGVPDNGRA